MIYLEFMGRQSRLPEIKKTKGLTMKEQTEKPEQEMSIDEMLRVDLAAGWDPLELDERRRNALQQMLSPDDYEVTPEDAVLACKVLMEHGVDPDACERGNSGGVWPTPLFMAVRQKNLGVAKILLEHGADPNRTDFDEGTYRSTPLFRAAAIGDKAMCHLLLDHGADPFVSRPLRFYGPIPAPETRESLGYKGHDVHSEMILNAGTATPLYIAAINGRLEVCHLLLERNADPTARVNVHIDSHPEGGPEGVWKETPAQAAERSGHFSAAGIIRAFLNQKSLEKALSPGMPFPQQTQAANAAKADGLQMVIGGQIWSSGQEVSKEASAAAMQAPKQRLRL